jgi:hypothetical protein
MLGAFTLRKNNHVARLAVALSLAALPAGATSITTTFTGTNGFSGNMFSATIAKSLTVTSLDVNVSTGAETIQVYEKGGTYVGFETNPAAWTLESTTTTTGLGEGLSTPLTVTPFSLSAGNAYSLYITISAPTSATMFYSNGNSTYANSDLSLSLGEGIGGLFGVSGVFPSRSWNGTINYSLITSSAVVPEPGSLALLAISLPGIWFLRRRRLS